SAFQSSLRQNEFMNFGHTNFGIPMSGILFQQEASGGLYTSINDLSDFLASVCKHPKAHTENKLPDWAGNLVEPSDEEAASKRTIGYTIYGQVNGNPLLGHGGQQEGWECDFRFLPETGNGIVILTNSANGYEIIKQVNYFWQSWVDPEIRKKPVVFLPIRLAAIIQNHGVNGAIQFYDSLKLNKVSEYGPLTANSLNRLGYMLMNNGRLKDALVIFKKNAIEFPADANVFDSLGEAYMKTGNYELAILNYQKSLAMDPSNKNAEQRINLLIKSGH